MPIDVRLVIHEDVDTLPEQGIDAVLVAHEDTADGAMRLHVLPYRLPGEKTNLHNIADILLHAGRALHSHASGKSTPHTPADMN